MGEKKIVELKSFLKNKYDVLTEIENPPVLNTGLVLYDEIIGGIPLGKMVSIQSSEGVGKTTLLVMLLGYIQKTQKDVIVVYLDSENSMTFQRMSNLGLNDLDKILYLQPSTLDEGYQMIYDLLKQQYSENLSFVFQYDSITASPTKQDIEGGLSQAQISLKARLNSQVLPKLIKPLKDTNSTLIMINQLRSNLKMGFGSFGKPDEDITGGRQIKFYQSQDIRLKQGERKEIEKYDFEGRVVKVKQNKNRLKSPLIEFPLILNYDKGFDNQLSNYYFLTSFLTKADYKKIGINPPVVNKGGWYSFDNQLYKDVLDVPENSFRSIEFSTYYNENEDVRKFIDGYVKTICQRLYEYKKDNYIYEIKKIKEQKENKDTKVSNEKKSSKKKGEITNE